MTTKKRKTAAKHWSLSWAKVGRSYVARVGGLTVSVVERGPKGPTKRWLVACPGLGNHEANYIRLAFQSTGPDGPDGPHGTTQQAIAYLRDYKPTRHSFEIWSDEQWAAFANQWAAKAKNAHDWLVAYSREPNPEMRAATLKETKQ